MKVNPILHAFSYHSVSGNTQDDLENNTLKMVNPIPIYPMPLIRLHECKKWLATLLIMLATKISRFIYHNSYYYLHEIRKY